MANFGWNYPPGVTGSEYEIAGPDYEKELDDLCPECDGYLLEQGYRHDRWILCSLCDYQKEIEYDN